MATSCLPNSQHGASRVKHWVGGGNLTMAPGSHELSFKCTFQSEILAQISPCIFAPNGNSVMKFLATLLELKMGLISFCLASTK